MNRLAFLFLSFFFLSAQAQKSNDPKLDQRLQEYLSLNKQLQFEKLMDYTHPRLFSVAPKEAIVQAMQQAFNNENMKFSIDSISIVSVGPVYKYGKESYRKINYHMGMTLMLNDSLDLKDQQMADVFTRTLQTVFPGKKISVDSKINAIQIAGKEIMFAIKDQSVKEWMFLGYDKAKPELSSQLYPRQVRQYFKLL